MDAEPRPARRLGAYSRANVKLSELQRGHWWARVRGQTFDAVKVGQLWLVTTRGEQDRHPVELAEVRTLDSATEAIIGWLYEHEASA